MKHGLIFLIAPPAFSKSVLTGRCPLFLVNSPANTWFSKSLAAPNICGILLFNLLYNLLRFSCIIFVSKSLNSCILFSCNSPINVDNVSFPLNTIFNKLSAKFPSTNGLTSSFVILLFSIVSTNILELDCRQSFFMFKYCDHKCRLGICPFQFFNCCCHSKNVTSNFSFLNINLFLGFNLCSRLDSVFVNTVPAWRYSCAPSSVLKLYKSFFSMLHVCSENVPFTRSDVNVLIHSSTFSKSLYDTVTSHSLPKYLFPASWYFVSVCLALKNACSFWRSVSACCSDGGSVMYISFSMFL